MTLDGFLTLLALLVAIYTLMPRDKKELLKLGKGFQFTAAVIAFCFVLYCHFYEYLINVSDLELSGLPWLLANTISPSKFSFIIVLCWAGLSFGIYKFFALKWHSPLPILSTIVNDFIYERNYKELVTFIKPWLPLISARPKTPHIQNFERFESSDVGLNSGSGFSSFDEPMVLGDQMGQHRTIIALIRTHWTYRCRESYAPAP